MNTYNSMRKKWPAIKEKFLELSQEVNCECFPKIFENESTFFSKLIWAFLFLLFSTFTCYLMSLNVFDYLRQDFRFNLNDKYKKDI